MPTIIRAEYLSYHNRARNSDKLYNVFLLRETNGTYTCLTENGRRGSSLVCRTVCENVRREQAESSFWQKVREKRSHTETPYMQETSGPVYSRISSLYSFEAQPGTVVSTTGNKSSRSKSNVAAFPIERMEKENPKSDPNGILNSEQFDSLEI